MKQKNILLGHGSGGHLTHDLIESIFLKHFNNPTLNLLSDAALLTTEKGKIAFTTDSFVVDPLFFPGGDIGKLAIAGTVNDLAVQGARPAFLSAGFILEEGLSMETLEHVVRSMAIEAAKAGIQIVTGDTKVVERGKCDKIFINTSGIGFFDEDFSAIGIENIKNGDKILINGSIGDHGMAVMSARNQLNISTKVESDCASLNGLINSLSDFKSQIRFMRDATRGGLATVSAELCKDQHFGIRLFEDKIPLNEGVRGICELLGFDPLYVANEGKVVMVVAEEIADEVLETMEKHELGKAAAIIGEITSGHAGKCFLETQIGGNRIVDMLAGEQLPRIC
ncbi:MAG: hydrogenase expression/formation protein HypE [Bacteroidales bacterium]|nr:hydrogenase expression/formation protein HypE [Bacteroidales bacterium]MDD4087451.1 hydrogenase expression/formation protein HypE [Bacteroidales bacterium]